MKTRRLTWALLAGISAAALLIVFLAVPPAREPSRTGDPGKSLQTRPSSSAPVADRGEAVARDQAAAAPAPGAGRQAPDREVRKPAGPAPQPAEVAAGPAPEPAPRWEGAEELERRETPVDAAGRFTRVRVVRTDLKYPLVRIQERIAFDPATGREQVLTSAAMVADHVIVRAAAGVGEDAFVAAMAEAGLRIRRRMAAPETYLVETAGRDADAVPRALETLSGKPSQAAYAEPDYVVSAVATPDDPSYGTLWGLHNTGQSGGTADADIDAPEAWDLTTGSSSVVVGVIDTGIEYTHPDLAANAWLNSGEIAGNGIDDDGNGYVDDLRGWDFYNNDADPMDDHFHGTHVAGTIGAAGNNSVGVVGVAWRVKMMALKFLSGSGSGYTSDAVEAVRYATRKGVVLTSNSWGGGGYTQSLADAIAEAEAAGILFVAAAGNSAANNDLTPHYPSSYANANILAVAATDRNDALASFSCYGATSVDLSAPGVAILSCGLAGTYRSASGTSMATPHVSGALALLKAHDPGQTATQLRARILGSVDPVPALTGTCVTGGRLNVAKALLPPDTVPPSAIGDLAAVHVLPFSAELTWTATGDDAGSGKASLYDVRYSTQGPITEAGWAAAVRVAGAPVPAPSGSPQSMTVTDLPPDALCWFAIRVLDDFQNVSGLSGSPEVKTPPLPPSLMTNGRFETGDLAGWTVSTGGAYPRVQEGGDAAEGVRYAAMGDGASGLGDGNTASIEQGVAVPAGALAVLLRMQYRVQGADDPAWDWMRVYVNGQQIASWWSDTEGWKSFSADLTAFAGSTVTVRIAAWTADSLFPVHYAVDDVAVHAFLPDSTPPAAADLDVASVTASSVTLRWAAPGDDGGYGTASGYDVRHSADGPITEASWASATAAEGEPAPAEAGTTQTFTVTGLESGTRRWFALKSRDERDNVSELSDSPSTTPADDLRMVFGMGQGAGGWWGYTDPATGKMTWHQMPWPAYNAATGSAEVAAGDIDGDGYADAVVSMGKGSNLWVFAYQRNPAKPLGDLQAFLPLPSSSPWAGWFKFDRGSATTYSLGALQAGRTAYGAIRDGDGKALADTDREDGLHVGIAQLDGVGAKELIVSGRRGGWFAVYRYNTGTRDFDLVTEKTMPWAGYNEANGEIRVTPAVLSPGANPSLVVTLGPGGKSWLAVYGPAPGFAFVKWWQAPWTVYANANGELWGAAGDLDGDGVDTVLLGMGAGGAGWLYAVEDLLGTPRPTVAAGLNKGWYQVRWGAYNTGNGTVRPAILDLNNDGVNEILAGLGMGGGGYVEVRNRDFTVRDLTGLPRGTHAGWYRPQTWAGYNSANGLMQLGNLR